MEWFYEITKQGSNYRSFVASQQFASEASNSYSPQANFFLQLRSDFDILRSNFNLFAM